MKVNVKNINLKDMQKGYYLVLYWTDKFWVYKRLLALIYYDFKGANIIMRDYSIKPSSLRAAFISIKQKESGEGTYYNPNHLVDKDKYLYYIDEPINSYNKFILAYPEILM